MKSCPRVLRENQHVLDIFQRDEKQCPKLEVLQGVIWTWKFAWWILKKLANIQSGEPCVKS